MSSRRRGHDFAVTSGAAEQATLGRPLLDSDGVHETRLENEGNESRCIRIAAGEKARAKRSAVEGFRAEGDITSAKLRAAELRLTRLKTLTKSSRAIQEN